MYTIKDWKEFKRTIILFLLKHPMFLYNAMMYGSSGAMLGWDHYVCVGYKSKMYSMAASEFGEELVSELDSILWCLRAKNEA